MREIKFRAWDKTMNMMIYQDDTEFEFRLTGKGIEVDDLTFVDTAFNEKHEDIDCEVMQYTGLKDKNGVEIYDGDILKIQTSDFYSKKIIDKYIAQVCFSRGGFFVLTDGHHTDFCLWGKNTEIMEVIGNIYENADLLEVE